MRICIDARNPSSGGAYTYIVSLLEALLSKDSEDEYLVLYDDLHGPLGIEGIQEKIILGHKPVQMILWNAFSLAQLLEAKKIDIYHGLKHPSVLRTKARTVYTFHSTCQFIFPRLWKKFEYIFWRKAAPSCARNADAVIALSQVEKGNIVQFMGVDPEKVHVINLASQKRFRPVTDQQLLEQTRERLKLPERYILFIGNIYPFKNVDNIVKSFHRLISCHKLPHKLVLAGGHGYRSGEIFTLIDSLGIKDRVIVPGFVSEELPALYTMADLFVFPSIYEAFGLPPLEAMACGVPVVTSNVGGIPEVVGEAAIQVDPHSIEAIADAMLQVLSNQRLRREMIHKGFERAAMFSWERCAQETLSLYDRVADGRQTVLP